MIEMQFISEATPMTLKSLPCLMALDEEMVFQSALITAGGVYAVSVASRTDYAPSFSLCA